jgi:hypothetical protein
MSNQRRPEAEALGRPPRGGRTRERGPRWGRAGQNGPARAVHVSVDPVGGLLVRKAPLGPLVSLEVQFALFAVQLLLLTDVLPHPGLLCLCANATSCCVSSTDASSRAVDPGAAPSQGILRDGCSAHARDAPRPSGPEAAWPLTPHSPLPRAAKSHRAGTPRAQSDAASPPQ